MVRIGMFLGDRYEILEKIGTGGMAEVFKGKDHKLNRFVAVKVLKDEFAEDKNFVRKFKEEAQAAAALAHPNIVNVYDVGDEQNINYIVMELVEGITLKTYIEKKGRLTVKEATSIAIQVASGLEVAHNNQIVHRDIKPQNIIISREGKVKVTDFGIAKSVSSNTNTADTMGSVHYTSPEQARGGYSDARSDIYSLGIVMYEMVTGRVPFDGETTVVVAVKHLQEDIVSPRVYASDVPVSLEHIILKCTEKSADRRYQNVTELVADLKQSLLTPDVNFVKDIVPDGAKTVAITRDEISKIKKETGRIPQSEDDAESRYAYLDRLNEENEDDEDYDDDDEDYDDEDYDDEDYDEDEYDEDDDEDSEDDEDDDGGVLDPKLEKIMMIGGIAAAVIIVIIVIVILVQIFGGGSKSSSDNENDVEIEDVVEEKVKVPELLGKSYSEAKEELNALGLGIKLGETRSSDEYEAGQIIEQSEDAGTEVDVNTTIVVDICGDGSQVEIPADLEGKTRTQVENALTALGLSVDITEVFSDDVDSGYVISTTPSAGSKVDKGGVVQVVISKGSEADAMVAVPDLRNRSESTAKQLLSSAGLSSGSVTQEYSDTVSEGNIISQSPSAGSKVEKGTSVSYVVSRGKESVYIGVDASPGNSESSVKSYLEGKGLVVNIIREYNDDYRDGIVYNVDPGNGSYVAPGSTVDVYVSRGPEPVTTAQVPDLTDRTVDEAKTLLGSNFNLVVEAGDEEAPVYTKNGLIYYQNRSGVQNIGTEIRVRTYANISSCTDKGRSHTAPSGTGEGVSTTCTVCGRTFTTPITSSTPSDGTGSGSEQPTT